MNKLTSLILFLGLNFGALAFGSYLMGTNPSANEWYQNLPRAPWTPPGWVFGAAWFTIMLLFSIFIGLQYNQTKEKRKLIWIYLVQLCLNISWNPVFFHYHQIGLALLILILLFSSLLYLLFYSETWNKRIGLLVLPYVIWLMIAISLNLYPLIA